MTVPDMTVDTGGLKLQNPVMTASGTFGYAREFDHYIDLNRLGGIIVKGLSLKPSKGNPPPRIVETDCGMLNAIGLENVGLKAFIKEKLPFLKIPNSNADKGHRSETFKMLLHLINLLNSNPDKPTNNGGEFIIHKFGFFLMRLKTALQMATANDNILNSLIKLFLDLEGYSQYLFIKTPLRSSLVLNLPLYFGNTIPLG